MEILIAPYRVKAQFNIEPYIDCLLDVADGMPKSIALRAHDINEIHLFKVHEIEFYCELLQAERFAIKNLLALVNAYSLVKNASKVFIWMLEKIYKDEAKISERIQKLLDGKARQTKEKQLYNYLESLDTDASTNNNTFYNRFSTH